MNLSDAVDLEFFAPDQVKQPMSVDTTSIILLPGRVTPSKGHLDALRALKILTSNGKRLCLAFAGLEESPGYCGMLRDFIEQNSLEDQVRFLGPLSQPQLRAWYDAVPSLFFRVTRTKFVGSSSNEQKLYFMAYHVGGTSDALISGRSGFLLKPGPLLGLAMKIGLLLDEPMQREGMGECGRKLCKGAFAPYRAS